MLCFGNLSLSMLVNVMIIKKNVLEKIYLLPNRKKHLEKSAFWSRSSSIIAWNKSFTNSTMPYLSPQPKYPVLKMYNKNSIKTDSMSELPNGWEVSFLSTWIFPVSALSSFKFLSFFPPSLFLDMISLEYQVRNIK